MADIALDQLQEAGWTWSVSPPEGGTDEDYDGSYDSFTKSAYVPFYIDGGIYRPTYQVDLTAANIESFTFEFDYEGETDAPFGVEISAYGPDYTYYRGWTRIFEEGHHSIDLADLEPVDGNEADAGTWDLAQFLEVLTLGDDSVYSYLYLIGSVGFPDTAPPLTGSHIFSNFKLVAHTAAGDGDPGGDPEPEPEPNPEPAPHRVVWHSSADKKAETGIDRGVLYPKSGPAVAWNGLTSVDENGGEAVITSYMDGRPYLHFPKPKEFEATLKAYTYPDEFLPMMGILEASEGMYLDSQVSESFDLSYRTLIADGIKGLDYAYKIHLIYNAVVVPQSKSYQTVSTSVNPTDFGWDISAVPIPVEGYRPTAHVILDSRFIDPDRLAAIEEILYGSESTPAMIPHPQDLFDTISYDNTVIITDLGDGTWTAEGSSANVLMLTPDTFQINNVDATDLGNGTYLIKTTTSAPPPVENPDPDPDPDPDPPPPPPDEIGQPLKDNEGTVDATAGARMPREDMTVMAGHVIANSGDSFVGVHFTGYVTIHGDPEFEDCYFSGTWGGSGTGAQVDSRAADVTGPVFRWCTFRPDTPSYKSDNLIGHHMHLQRCLLELGVDGVGSYNTHANEVNNRIEDSYLGRRAWYYPDPNGVQSNGTHCDLVQHQGGTGLWILRCTLFGYVTAVSGSLSNNPAGGPPFYDQTGQIVQVQNNTGHDVGDIHVNDNWIYGGSNGIHFDNVPGVMGPVEVKGNKWMDLPRADGPHYNHVRMDSGVTLNGVTRSTAGFTVAPDIDENVWGFSGTGVEGTFVSGQSVKYRVG